MPAAPDRLLLWGSAVVARAAQDPDVVLHALRRSARSGPVVERVRALLSGTEGMRRPRRTGSRSTARAAWREGRWQEGVEAAPRGSRLRSMLAAEHAAALWRPESSGPARLGQRTTGRVRVLHLVTNSLPHTASGYTHRTHASLGAARERLGLEVAAVTPLGYPATVGRLPGPRVETVEGLDYHRLLPRWQPADARVRLARWLQELERTTRALAPDVLHAHSHYPNALAALHLRARLGLPVVYEVRGVLEETWAQRTGEHARSSERYAVFRSQEEYAVRHADAVVAIGAGLRDDLAARTGRDDIRLVPNAVDEAVLATGGDRRRTRATLGIAPDAYVVGSVSSIVDYEGFDVLLAAAGLLAAGGSPVTVLLVGSGDDHPRLSRLGRALPPGARLLMPGSVPKQQVPDYLAALDAFVVPRRDVPVCRLVTPLKPAEAMAASLPLVLSDLPALREFADDGEEGLLVPPEDPDALAAALRRLTDGRLRRRLGEAARARVTRDRTWAANAAVYRQVYEEVSSDGVGR